MRAAKSKIVGGLLWIFLGGKSARRSGCRSWNPRRACSNILEMKQRTKDNIGKTYYNGRPTIANKCKFIKENDYAGVMIWQLFQDAHDDNYMTLKLINVVGREME